jgi:hypothetical protein
MYSQRKEEEDTDVPQPGSWATRIVHHLMYSTAFRLRFWLWKTYHWPRLIRTDIIGLDGWTPVNLQICRTMLL